MKRIKVYAVVASLALLALALSACGRSYFGVTDYTDTEMTITAENAGKDAFFMSGSLEVADGEEITITSNLTKGTIQVELVAAPEEQSMNRFPETDGEALITESFSGTYSTSCPVPAGSYMVRATCLKKAEGTVQIEIQPAVA